MSFLVKVGGYDFFGWLYSVSSLHEDPGVYAVGCEKNGITKVIDVGETDNIQDRIKKHDRKDCWEKECKDGEIIYSEYRTNVSKEKRMEIEKEIREKEDPPCGKE